MEKKQVYALLSDYDGTLCPTTAVKGDGNDGGGTTPKELEQALDGTSECISVCIISSKHFTFLHKRARFANILSCVLGIKQLPL
jgi:hypothetical protein